MKEIKVHSTRYQIEEFKNSVIWKDIKRELSAWKLAFRKEMMAIVDDSATENPSTASVLMHLGDINGRQKAVDYILSLPDIFLNILEDTKDGSRRESTE